MRWKNVLFVLAMVAVVLGMFMLPGDGWSAEVEEKCELPKPPVEVGVPIDPAFWKAAKDLTGMDASDPPNVVYGHFDPCLNLSGWYFKDKNVVQIDERLKDKPLVRDYFIIHEAVHALWKEKYPLILHHCLMAESNYAAKELNWLASRNGRQVPDEVYGIADVALVEQCLSSVPGLLNLILNGESPEPSM